MGYGTGVGAMKCESTPTDLWELIEWAKLYHGVALDIKTETSWHGGVFVTFSKIDSGQRIAQFGEKTQLEIGRNQAPLMARWAKVIREKSA